MCVGLHSEEYHYVLVCTCMYGDTDDVILINACLQIYEYVVCTFSGVQVVCVFVM
jgi:hypothetical protein